VGRRRSSRCAFSRWAVFGLLALICELTGRSLTASVDRAVHVRPLAAPMTSYYPFLLAGIRVLAAVTLAGIAWRLVRAHGTAAAGEAVLRAVGQRGVGMPSLRVRLTPKLWLASFGATALWFLVQDDAERLSEGQWPLFAPWLHTYALPVFAVLSVLLALAWEIGRDWLDELEAYAADVVACACRALRDVAVVTRRGSSPDDRAPRNLFGASFESRPPPLPA
jgi:hypothetical protein